MAACDFSEKYRVSDPVREDLRINYFGEDISRLIREYRNRDSFKSYFDADKDKYQFRGSSSFKDMISDDYFLLDHDSIIFISFVSSGSDKELVEATLQLNQNSAELARRLIDHAIDNVDMPNQSFGTKGTMFFLGIYPIEGFPGMKVFLNQYELSNGLTTYSLRYDLRDYEIRRK
jgi:hypothetical protein